MTLRTHGSTISLVLRAGLSGGALLLTLAAPAGGQQRVASPFALSSAATMTSGTTPLAGSMGATVATSRLNDTTFALVAEVADTVRPRPVAIEYSDWYGRRLKIHQVASWAMLPLFAAQYAAGQQLIDKGRFGAPSWARNSHGPLATGIGVLFGVNTVTGVWNLWDARKDPAARKWRTAHAILMLAADAGFAITPAFVNDDGNSSASYESNLRTHRNVAIASMSVATVSWLMMLPPFRRE